MSKLKNNTNDLHTILDAVNDLPSYEAYSGAYQVVPKVVSQTLATANKLMQANVTVEEIPYAEVSNDSGGKTASIG